MVLVLNKMKGLGFDKNGLGLENFTRVGLSRDGLNSITATVTSTCSRKSNI